MTVRHKGNGKAPMGVTLKLRTSSNHITEDAIDRKALGEPVRHHNDEVSQTATVLLNLHGLEVQWHG